VLAVDYLQARAALAEAQRRCAAAAAGYDVLLCASAPCPPFPIDGPDKTTRMNALTKPFNGLGWPALSLPAGLDRDGLPLGLQVVGLPGNEAVVLRAASALEALLQG
jgi:Asp-tRNA(Asn)/Glu-tRNA(Gln) amidotransferase A subunit family amidase